MLTVTRTQLREAVEDGISASFYAETALLAADANALRRVTDRIKRVQVGGTFPGAGLDDGCPAYIAGLWPAHGRSAPGVFTFAMAFDSYMRLYCDVPDEPVMVEVTG